MRIEILDDKHGVFRVKIDSEDDLWLLSLVISRGDIVKAVTLRDVSIGDEKRKIPMVLSIEVIRTEFQAFTNRLRVHGIVVEGPDRFGVKGSHHTISIGVGSEVTVFKKVWSKDFIESILRFSRSINIVIVAVDFDEYAIALIQQQGVKIIDERAISLPVSDYGFEEEKNRLIEELTKKIVDIMHRYRISDVVIGSPGSLKDEVRKRILELDPDIRVYTDSTANGGYAGIQELLHRDVISRMLRDTAIVKATEILNEFNYLLMKDIERVAYGLKDIEILSDIGAIEKLVIIDEIVMFSDDREKIDKILRSVMERRGEVIIVPSNTPVGERLKMLGGAIAILRYKVPRE